MVDICQSSNFIFMELPTELFHHIQQGIASDIVMVEISEKVEYLSMCTLPLAVGVPGMIGLNRSDAWTLGWGC